MGLPYRGRGSAGGSVAFRGVSGSQPEACVAGLEGDVDGIEHAECEGVEFDLVAESSGEAVECLGGVVLLAVEAVIDGPLDPASQRLERERDGQRGDGHRERAGLACERLKRPADQIDPSEVDDCQRRDQRAHTPASFG